MTHCSTVETQTRWSYGMGLNPLNLPWLRLCIIKMHVKEYVSWRQLRVGSTETGRFRLQLCSVKYPSVLYGRRSSVTRRGSLAGLVDKARNTACTRARMHVKFEMCT